MKNAIKQQDVRLLTMLLKLNFSKSAIQEASTSIKGNNFEMAQLLLNKEKNRMEDFKEETKLDENIRNDPRTHEGIGFFGSMQTRHTSIKSNVGKNKEEKKHNIGNKKN